MSYTSTVALPSTPRGQRYEARIARQRVEPRKSDDDMRHALLERIQEELRSSLLSQIIHGGESAQRAGLDVLARVEISRDRDGQPPLITQAHIDAFKASH